MLPSQITDNLPEGLSAAEIDAGVLVRRGLNTPIGETAILRRGGEWIALVRESIFAPYAIIDLAPGRKPRLEGEGFDESLVVETATGEVHRLRISGFEREDLIELLGPPPARPPPPPAQPPSSRGQPPPRPAELPPQPDFAFSRPGPISTDSIGATEHKHQPAHMHEPPHEHSGSIVLLSGDDQSIVVDDLELDETPPDPRTTLDEDVRRIAAQQGVNFAVMHYAEVAGVNLHEANGRVKKLLGKGKGKNRRQKNKYQRGNSRQVEAAVLDLLRAKKMTAAILLYCNAMKVDVTEARKAVAKLAAEHGINTSGTGMVALVLGLAIVVAVLGLLVFLVK